jgi:hypothetical protein
VNESNYEVESIPPQGGRAILLVAKFAGLILMLGGFAALIAMWLFGPEPLAIEEWRFHRRMLRAVFLACVFGGLVITLVAGLALYIRRQSHWRRQRWFIAKLAMIVVLLPPLHFWGRGRMMAMDEALAEGDLALAAQAWEHAGWAFTIALGVLSVIALLGALRPGDRSDP